jgi:hypothetical protein
MNERNGDWFQTYTGGEFYIIDPRPDEIKLRDIAHALSLQCRFNGHCKWFYSVAQHSVLVAQCCEKRHGLWGLLHDATEAYMGDMVRPLKISMSEYRVAEERLMKAVCERFNLSWPMPPEVKKADEVLLATEARDIMAAPPKSWRLREDPLDEPITPWGPEVAERVFLEEFVRQQAKSKSQQRRLAIQCGMKSLDNPEE